jgi:hypothetical protein
MVETGNEGRSPSRASRVRGPCATLYGMGDPAPKPLRDRSLVGKIGAIGAGYLALLYASVPLQRQVDRLHDWWWAGREWPSGGAMHRVLDLLGHGFATYFSAGYVTLFATSLVVVPLAYLARTLARARIRSGGRDPIERTRRWVSAHPASVRAVSVVPAALWSLFVGVVSADSWWQFGQFEEYERLGVEASFGIIAVLATVAFTGLIRTGVRAFVAPVVDDRAPQRTDVAKNEITFDAVAVTTETRAAVAAMMVLNAAAILVALSSDRALHDPKALAGFAAYVALAFGGAALFRHASKVAVGVDGVLVRGTSRTRFFAYRDLDAARVDGDDLELVRRDRVVLRLQLHSEDAAKRSAVLARIRDAIDRVKEGRGAVSAQLVSSATPAELARAAGGGADYRGAALTRDQLWALVEGPEVDEPSRRAAAEALAKTSGADERARLRVAAEHCAAPAMRVALEKLALEEDAFAGPAPARRSA